MTNLDQKITMTSGGAEGLILPFALFILVLLSVMGMVLLASSLSQVDRSYQTKLLKDTFNAAESSAMVSTLLTRIILRPKMGPVTEALRSGDRDQSLEIILDPNRFNLPRILKDSEESLFTERYLETGWGGAGGQEPSLKFLVGGKLVTEVAVTFDNRNVFPPGSGVGENDSYDASAGTSKSVTIIVTVRGLSDYLAPGKESSVFITSMFRDVM
jgi:hypothetical protein